MGNTETFPYPEETLTALVQRHELGLAWLDASLTVRSATLNFPTQLGLAGPLSGQPVSELAPELEDAADLLSEVRDERRPSIVFILTGDRPGAERSGPALLACYPLQQQGARGLLLVSQRIRLGAPSASATREGQDAAAVAWPQVALVDPLTWLGNRQAFEQELAARARVAAANSSDLSIAIIDLDDFRSINERLGRLEGDRLLQACARALLFAFRRNDTAFRTGDDEFAVILPATLPADFDGLHERFERIFEQVRQEGFAGAHASLGLAAISEQSNDPERTLQLALQRMQITKRSHRARG